MIDIINVLNFVDIILVGLLCILSYKVIHAFDKCGGSKPRWFAILPYVFVYSFLSRIGIYLSTVGIISPSYANIIIAGYTVFYVGMIAFMYGMNEICSRINTKLQEK